MAYLNVVEIESALLNLAEAYPQVAELLPCPNLTHEGRRTHVLRIGAQRVDTADGVLLVGGIHAREWVPPDALVSLAADLLEARARGTGLGYGGASFSADQVRQIVETLNLFVFPCVNPDGRHYSQTGVAMWRKNRRPRPASGSCEGVDVNRNFDFLWDHVHKFASDAHVQTSADPCSDVYRGPAPASEPEVRNVLWLLDSYPRIRWHVDVHSAVPVILYSWGSDQDQTSDPNQTFLNSALDSVRGRADDTAYREYIAAPDLALVTSVADRVRAAVKAVRGDDYGVEQAFGLYPTSGASDDYAFARHAAEPSMPKVYGFTVECGHSFQPAWSEAENVIREVSAGLIGFCLGAVANPSQSLAILQTTGKVVYLRAHDVGTGWGPPQDFLHVEAVVRLSSVTDGAMGSQLRTDDYEVARGAELDLLRDALAKDRPITVDYEVAPGRRNGRIIRVAISRS